MNAVASLPSHQSPPLPLTHTLTGSAALTGRLPHARSGASAEDTALSSQPHSIIIPTPETSHHRITAPCTWEGRLEAMAALIKSEACVGVSQTKGRESGEGFPGGETSMSGSERECGSEHLSLEV